MRHSVDAGHPGRTAFFRQAASLRRGDERRETEALRKSPSGGTVHPDRNRHGKTRRVEGTAPKRRRKAVPGPLDGRGGRQGKGDEAAPRGEEGRDGFTEPDRTFRLKHGGKPAQGKGRLRTAGLLKRFLGRRWELVRPAFEHSGQPVVQQLGGGSHFRMVGGAYVQFPFRCREQHPARREQEQRGDLHEHRAEKRESFGSVSHTSFPCSEDA